MIAESPLPRIAQLAKHCRDLKARGIVSAGVEYFINDEFQVDVRTLPLPSVVNGQPPFDMAAFLEGLSANSNAARKGVSSLFDMSPHEWNASAIGRFLKLLADLLKANMERESVHNINAIQSLCSSFHALADFLISNPYSKLSANERFNALNAFAREEGRRFLNIQILIMMSNIAELVIAIDDLSHVAPDLKTTERLAARVIEDAERCMRWFDALEAKSERDHASRPTHSQGHGARDDV